MNINKVWDNSKITLWQIDGDQKWFRNVVDLQIHLKNRREIGEACLYCGSPLKPGENCIQCGGPAGDDYQRIGVAEVTIRGVMPWSDFLLFLPERSTFELIHRNCGRPDVYYPEGVFMRLIDMEVISCDMPDLITHWPDNLSEVKIMTVLEGQAQMFILGEEQVRIREG